MNKDKKYLVISEDEKFIKQTQKLLTDGKVFPMNSIVEGIQFYKMFHQDIDIVIIDEDIKDIEKFMNKYDKPVLFIKKPINNDEFLKKLLEKENQKVDTDVLKKHLTDIANKDNYDKIQLIQEKIDDIVLEPNFNNMDKLLKSIDIFYGSSRQTNLHIDNTTRYTMFFAEKIKEKMIQINKLYNENKGYIKSRKKSINGVQEYIDTLERLGGDKEFPNLLKEAKTEMIKEKEEFKEIILFQNSLEKKQNEIFKDFFNEDFIKELNSSECNNSEIFKEKVENKIFEMVLGGFFHDIGKNLTPKSILDKPSGLNDNEFKQMKNHSNFGSNILEMLKDKDNEKVIDYIKEIAKNHHSNKSDISASSKFVKFADILDATLTMRSYKPAFSIENSLYITLNGIEKNYIKSSDFFPVNKVFNENKNNFYDIYYENLIRNKDYYNDTLSLNYYKNEKIDKKVADKVILKSTYNILNNLNSFPNKLQQDCKYLNSLNMFQKIIIDKNKILEDDVNKIKINPCKIDLNKCKEFFKVFDKEILTQYGCTFLNNDNLTKKVTKNNPPSSLLK